MKSSKNHIIILGTVALCVGGGFGIAYALASWHRSHLKAGEVEARRALLENHPGAVPLRAKTEQRITELANDDRGGTNKVEFPRVNREQPSESDDSPTDPEWDRLPRTTFDFARVLAGSPSSLGAAQLLRNRSLNPRDLYIPKHVRVTLDSILKPRLSLVLRALALVDDTGWQEFRLLAASGKARQASIAEATKAASSRNQEREEVAKLAASILPAEARKAGPLVQYSPGAMFGKWPRFMLVSGDTVQAADIQELPETERAFDAQEYFALDCAGTVLTWFESVGALRPSESGKVYERLESILDEMRGK